MAKQIDKGISADSARDGAVKKPRKESMTRRKQLAVLREIIFAKMNEKLEEIRQADAKGENASKLKDELLVLIDAFDKVNIWIRMNQITKAEKGNGKKVEQRQSEEFFRLQALLANDTNWDPAHSGHPSASIGSLGPAAKIYVDEGAPKKKKYGHADGAEGVQKDSFGKMQ